MCMEDRSRGDKAELESPSKVDEEVHHEGGDEENQLEFDELQHDGGDEEDLGTDRNINAGGYYDRADRYRVDTDNNYLDTQADIAKKKPKKKKAKGKAKKKSPNKAASKTPKKSMDSNKEDKKTDGSDKDKKPKKKRDLRNLHDLGYFNRVWRSLQPKYCSHCDEEIRCHHEEFVCKVGHVLHLSCAKVKWVGSKV